jgi:hypothetical protein
VRSEFAEFNQEETLMRKLSLITIVAMLTLLFCAVGASATDVLYTSLGPNGEYDTGSGYFVDGSNYFNQVLAYPFNPSLSEQVVDVVLALGNYAGGNSPINLYLETDDGLNEPGSIMATFTQQGTIQPFANGGSLITFNNCTGNCSVDTNSQYWIVAQEQDPNTEQAWFFAYQDGQGHGAFNQLGSATGPWSQYDGTIAGFRVDGMAGGVPEPGTLIMLGSGVLAAAAGIRRKLGV